MLPRRFLLCLWPALLAVLSICLPLNSGSARQGVIIDNVVVRENKVAQAAALYEGDIYILRGGAGIFSIGLTKLAAELKQSGVASNVKSHAAWRLVARTIVRNQAQYGRRPVILIGHSLGADSTIRIAHALKKAGVEVDYVASFAATGPATIPSNVRSITNFYFNGGGWGAMMTAESDFRGILDNRDMSAQRGVTHFNIDDDSDLHDEVVRDVLRYVRSLKSAMALE